MTPLTTSVDTPRREQHQTRYEVPDSPAGLFGSFAVVDLVGAAAASLDVLDRHATPEEWMRWKGLDWARHLPTDAAGRPLGSQLMSREGVVWRIEVSPGSVAFRSRDYGRADATEERQKAHTEEEVERLDYFARLRAEIEDGREPVRRGKVRSWSTKSRAKMVERLSTLDYEPMISQGAPAMVTLTYPGDWVAVAPTAQVAAQHLRLLQLRFRRAFDRKMIGVWKREFQDRGAPHWHILMTPPAVPARDGRTFRVWLAETWVEIVGAAGCGHAEPANGPSGRIECCERHRHLAAHLHDSVVDQREGARYVDPRRVGVYFGKHGSFAAKDYQNEAPAEWLDDETAGIGRFWGVWGLKPVVRAVEVPPDVADAARRTARRWQAATALRDRSGAPSTMTVKVWRKKTTIDRETGEIGFRWVRRNVRKRIRPRLRGRGGFLALNDGPALAMDLGRYVDAVVAPVVWQPGRARPLP